MFRLVFLFLFLWTHSVGAAGAGFYGVEVFGNFKQMMHTGDTSGKVRLRQLRTDRGLYGLGALAGLRGEIWIWDGNIAVSRGDSATGATEPAKDTDEATLLITARVKNWKEVRVQTDMSSEQFEKYVVREAKANGINVEQPFPFSVRGGIREYQWHVVNGPGEGHGQSDNRVFKASLGDVVLLGFYSGVDFEGIISHPGERFHIHYANPTNSISGHLDAYSIAKDSFLLLPVP
jgi:alpha-acetolactate decarboxylase